MRAAAAGGVIVHYRAHPQNLTPDLHFLSDGFTRGNEVKGHFLSFVMTINAHLLSQNVSIIIIIIIIWHCKIN